MQFSPMTAMGLGLAAGSLGGNPAQGLQMGMQAAQSLQGQGLRDQYMRLQMMQLQASMAEAQRKRARLDALAGQAPAVAGMLGRTPGEVSTLEGLLANDPELMRSLMSAQLSNRMAGPKVQGEYLIQPDGSVYDLLTGTPVQLPGGGVGGAPAPVAAGAELPALPAPGGAPGTRPGDPTSIYQGAPAPAAGGVASPQAFRWAQKRGGVSDVTQLDPGSVQAAFQANNPGLLRKRPDTMSPYQQAQLGLSESTQELNERKFRAERAKAYEAMLGQHYEIARQGSNIMAMLDPSRDSSGVTDLAAVTSFAKMLDPGTAAREGEVEAVRSAQGALNSLISRFEAATKETGGVLAPAGRQALREAVARILELTERGAQEKMERIRGRAELQIPGSPEVRAQFIPSAPRFPEYRHLLDPANRGQPGDVTATLVPDLGPEPPVGDPRRAAYLQALDAEIARREAAARGTP